MSLSSTAVGTTVRTTGTTGRHTLVPSRDIDTVLIKTASRCNLDCLGESRMIWAVVTGSGFLASPLTSSPISSTDTKAEHGSISGTGRTVGWQMIPARRCSAGAPST